MKQLIEVRQAIKNLKMNTPEFLNYRQAAAHLGRSYGATRQLVFAGKLPAYRSVDGRVYLKVQDLNDFMRGFVKSQ